MNKRDHPSFSAAKQSAHSRIRASKLSLTAFSEYVEMGASRSYSAIAKRFGVDKTTVVRQAKLERWQERIREIEAEAWSRQEMSLADRMANANRTALDICDELRSKCLGVLRRSKIDPSLALRGLQLAIETERIVLGMPRDRVSRDSRVAVARVHADAVPNLCSPPRSGVPDTTLGEPENALVGSNPMSTFMRNALPTVDDQEVAMIEDPP